MLDTLTGPGAAVETPTPSEQHYAPAEIAILWRLDVETIRRLFRNEAGVIVLASAIKKGKRRYSTLRIPQSVLERVHQRLQR